MIEIDSRSSRPIYEQIIEKIKENILKGILRPGDKLPSVRELSAMITVNPNTVSKAYKELERERAIEVLRGKGTYIANNFKPKVDDEKVDMIKSQIKKLIIEAHYLGIGKEKFTELLNNEYKTLKKED